jgi:hypothetical protein
MNEVDRYLIRNGFNLDGSKMKKKEAGKENKKNLKTESLLATKENVHRLKYKREAIEDRKGG